MTLWNITEVDEGFCKIVYSKETSRVCFLDEGSSIRCMTITDYDEPCTEIKLAKHAFKMFELPSGDSELQRRVRAFLEDGIKTVEGEVRNDSSSSRTKSE